MLNYFLDQTSDRYRICPSCKCAHMVANRGRDFCSDKCADTYYNTHRRFRKQAIEILTPELQSITDNESVLQTNYSLLNDLPVDPVNGTRYPIIYLLNIGFNFSYFTERNELYNTPVEQQCFSISIYSYRIYLLNITEVLISKTI